MKIATLRTHILSTAVGSGGVYEQPVQLTRRRIEKSGDPRGFIMKTISEHLAVAMQHTEVPFAQWTIHFEPEVQRQLNVPAVVDLDDARTMTSLPIIGGTAE